MNRATTCMTLALFLFSMLAGCKCACQDDAHSCDPCPSRSSRTATQPLLVEYSIRNVWITGTTFYNPLNGEHVFSSVPPIWVDHTLPIVVAPPIVAYRLKLEINTGHTFEVCVGNEPGELPACMMLFGLRLRLVQGWALVPDGEWPGIETGRVEISDSINIDEFHPAYGLKILPPAAGSNLPQELIFTMSAPKGSVRFVASKKDPSVIRYMTDAHEYFVATRDGDLGSAQTLSGPEQQKHDYICERAREANVLKCD